MIYFRNLLEIALKYNELNFPVVPVCYRSKDETIDWEPYQSKKPSIEQIIEWFSHAHCNIAIVLGKISTSLEIDVDGELGRKHFERIFAGINPILQKILSNTMRIVSASGYKLILRYIPSEYPEGICTVRLWKGEGQHNGVELRGNGACSVALGSIHPSGHIYVLAEKNEFYPITVSKSEIEEIVAAISGIDVCEGIIAKLSPTASQIRTRDLKNFCRKLRFLNPEMIKKFNS